MQKKKEVPSEIKMLRRLIELNGRLEQRMLAKKTRQPLRVDWVPFYKSSDACETETQLAGKYKKLFDVILQNIDTIRYRRHITTHLDWLSRQPSPLAYFGIRAIFEGRKFFGDVTIEKFSLCLEEFVHSSRITDENVLNVALFLHKVRASEIFDFSSQKILVKKIFRACVFSSSYTATKLLEVAHLDFFYKDPSLYAMLDTDHSFCESASDASLARENFQPYLFEREVLELAHPAVRNVLNEIVQTKPKRIAA